MKPRSLLITIGLWIALLATIGSGCRREVGPPPPLAVENIPAEFEKGFARAKASVKNLSVQVLTALQAKDYPAAYLGAQSLCAAPEATNAEKQLAVRAMLTINGLLQTAQSQGDEKAAEVILLQKKFK